jgi:hypothetical protein
LPDNTIVRSTEWLAVLARNWDADTDRSAQPVEQPRRG